MQINKIADLIEDAFGSDSDPSVSGLSDLENLALQNLIADLRYQPLLDDQTNRQIIRTYLINAVVLGHFPQDLLSAYASHVDTPEGRAAVSLQMLMHPVEHASKLLNQQYSPTLVRINQTRSDPPHLEIVD